jgi:hypothetical protein
MTMITRRLAIAIVLLTFLLHPSVNARELRPTTEIPIGGYSSAINHTTNILYTAIGLSINSYDLEKHEVLPPIPIEGGYHWTLTINEISNTIFFSDEEGTWMIDGDTQALSYFTDYGVENSQLLTQVNRRANTMYALYVYYGHHGEEPELHLEAYEADTLAFITSTYWYNTNAAAFGIDERDNKIYMHMRGDSKIRVLDGTTLELLGTFAHGILDGPPYLQFLPFDPVARRLYAYSRFRDGVAVIDVDEQEIISTIDITTVRDVVVDKYRRRAFVTSLDDAQLYYVNRHGELDGSVTVSKIGSITGIPAVHWRTGSVYVPCWDDGYQGLAVIRRRQVAQTVHLDTLINKMIASGWSRRVYAVGQPTTSWKLLLMWFGHSSIGDMDSIASGDQP